MPMQRDLRQNIVAYLTQVADEIHDDAATLVKLRDLLETLTTRLSFYTDVLYALTTKTDPQTGPKPKTQTTTKQMRGPRITRKGPTPCQN